MVHFRLDSPVPAHASLSLPRSAPVSSLTLRANRPVTLRKVAVIGNFTPRRCGIATFTSDVVNHLRENHPDLKVDVYAMSDDPSLVYPEEVARAIPYNDPDAYLALAQELNRQGYDAVCLQHEFGIFGGEAGAYLLNTLRNIDMPIVATLHTVLENPSEAQHQVFQELLQLCERVIVMSARAVQILERVYQVCPQKVDLIHHGIHDTRKDQGVELRKLLKIGDRPLLLTFGLLSFDKGIMNMVEAMPAILAEAPDALYAVVGATHPHVRAHEGEKYRESLSARAEELGVRDHIVFVDRFVSNDELAAWLSAADIYVTPYLKPEQITSGTLAYALGAGCPIISTPYWYAEELLAEDRGVLVPFQDPAALSAAACALLRDGSRRADMSRRAALFGRDMRWPVVADRYFETLERARDDGQIALRDLTGSTVRSLEFKLDHVTALCDDTGLFQHATHRFPNRNEGYCTDDNARLVTLLAPIHDLSPAESAIRHRALTFTLHAYRPELNRFRNFMSFERTWLDEVGSDDCHARAVLALATACRNADSSGFDVYLQGLAVRSLFAIIDMTSPRAWSTGILAAQLLMDTAAAPRVRPILQGLTHRLHALLTIHRREEWVWFEDRLAHNNALLSHALIVGGSVLEDRSKIAAGLASLEWLMAEQTFPKTGCFAPIGSDRDWIRGQARPWFDQQPIEAAASVAACLAADRVEPEGRWCDEARRAFTWFLGENQLGLKICSPHDGACYDGLHEDRVNENCGAESTLCYLQAVRDLQTATARKS